MDVNMLQNNLYRLGYMLQTQISGSLDITTANALKRFQTDNGLVASGAVDQITIAAIISAISNSITVDSVTISNEDNDIIYTENYEDIKNNPFFERAGTFRMNNVPIRIEYGTNKAFQKTITNVRFRSAGQEIDGSGNPIYEVIEFIGRDIKEER